jgi:hypothetical protein
VREGAVIGVRATNVGLPGYIPLKGQIALALQQAGVRAELDVGTSVFRVPLAVQARGDESRYSVAVLCDEGDELMGAFERHVHRPALLRARGWRVVRVTAREWARDANGVLRKIRAELDRGAEAEAGLPALARLPTVSA